MKIPVTLIIEIDPKLWAEYNGLDGSTTAASRVRDDVRKHVLNHTQGSALIEEANGTVILKTSGR